LRGSKTEIAVSRDAFGRSSFIHTKVTHPEIDGKPLQLALNRAPFRKPLAQLD
jgi:hypothetical protein